MSENEKRPKALVSIGLPLYNSAASVAAMIESLRRQTYDNIEIIISDNASTDGTAEICRTAAAEDERIRYYRYPSNVGGLRNFNRCAELAQGAYFMWAAGDDRFEPQFIERCLGIMEKNPDVVLTYCATRLVDASSGREQMIYRDRFSLLDRDPAVRFETLLNGLDLCNMLHGLMRADALHRSGLLRAVTQISDVHFLAEMALAGRIVQLEEVLFTRSRAARDGETLEQRAARLERWIFGDSPHRPIALPFVRLIGCLTESLQRTALDAEKRERLSMLIPQIITRRYGQFINFEIMRAVNLALEGIFEKPWGGESLEKPHFAEQFRQAAHLLKELEDVGALYSDLPGLQLARASALLHMGRNEEAVLAAQNELHRHPELPAAQEMAQKLGLKE